MFKKLTLTGLFLITEVFIKNSIILGKWYKIYTLLRIRITKILYEKQGGEN